MWPAGANKVDSVFPGAYQTYHILSNSLRTARAYKPRINIRSPGQMLFIGDFWLIYNNGLNTEGRGETQTCGPQLNDGVGGVEGRGGRGVFLLETVNLISQHSSCNRKSNSVRAALSISRLAAPVDKCRAEMIYSAYILDILMLFIYLFIWHPIFFWKFLWFIYLAVVKWRIFSFFSIFFFFIIYSSPSNSAENSTQITIMYMKLQDVWFVFFIWDRFWLLRK